MKKVQTFEEQYYVSQLEYYCYKLRDAIIDISLKYPELETFERYFNKIKEYDSMIYILSLLHKCWCFANPQYLFDTTPKSYSYEEVDKCLGKLTPGSPRYGTDMLKEEFGKKYNPLCAKYYKEYLSSGGMKLCYGDYMDNLYQIVSLLCRKFNIKLDKRFIIVQSLKTESNLSPCQLKGVFEIISAKFKCCENNETNLQVFISMFDTTVSVPEGTIMWKDIGSSRGKEPSLASIDTVFRSLGVKMNLHNKTIISRYITWQNGKIIPEQIKPRNTAKQKSLEEAILQFLGLLNEDVIHAECPEAGSVSFSV